MKKRSVSIFMCIAAHALPPLYIGLYQQFLADNSTCDLAFKFVLTMFAFPVLFGLLLCGFVLNGMKSQLYTKQTIVLCLSVLVVIIIIVFVTGFWMHLISCKDALIMFNMLPAAWAVLLIERLLRNA